MLVIYTLVALFISWIWVDYFRLIDVFETENIITIFTVFALGALSVFFVFAVSDYIPFFKDWQANGNHFNDFLYSFIGIGLIEEIAKIIPLLLAVRVFKNAFNEPIDYIAFASVSALGFSAVENVMYYSNYGVYIIIDRAVLSSVAHMIFTSMTAYALVRTKYLKKASYEFILFLVLSALSHGIYDFWLINDNFEGYGFIATILFFLITVSVFATIINNCLNNSPFFTYKKMVDNVKVSKRLFIYYGSIYAIQIILIGILFKFNEVLLFFGSIVNYIAFIVVVLCLRLSRMKLIKGRWNPIKLEFPFYYYPPFSFTIKGDGYNEIVINKFFNEIVTVNPLSYRNTYLDNEHQGYLEVKKFLKNDETYYLTKIYDLQDDTNFNYYFIKPKTKGSKLVDKEYPICALLKVNIEDVETYKDFYFNDFEFLEWVFITPSS